MKAHRTGNTPMTSDSRPPKIKRLKQIAAEFVRTEQVHGVRQSA